MRGIRNIASGFATLGLALVILSTAAFSARATDTEAAAATTTEVEPAPPKTHFIRVGHFIIPVIRGSQVTRHVSFAVSLEVTGDEKKAEVEEMMPRVKDAILCELLTHMSRRREPDAVTEILKLKKKLRKASNDLLGDGTINAILIENTLDRKIL